MSSKFSALYYPYSRCVNLDALKLFALLYEEIVFIDPLDEPFREFLISSDKGCQYVPASVRAKWKENQESWNILREAEILKMVDPLPIIQENDQILTASYAADIADESFVQLAEREGQAAGPWKMLESRLPPSVNASFLNHDAISKKLKKSKRDLGHHIVSDYQNGVFAWEQYDHHGYREYLLEKLGGRPASNVVKSYSDSRKRAVLDASPLSAYEQLYLSGGGTCKEDGQPFGLHPYTYVDTASDPNGEPIRILAFSQGASLSISQALLIADIHGFTPVTDNALHQQLLTLKYKRALDNISLIKRSSIPRRSLDILEQYSVIARAVLLETLSSSFLSKLSMQEILKYREGNQDALERFWLKIREISHELDGLEVNQDFETQLTKLIDKLVMPEFQSLIDSLKFSRTKMFGSLVSKLSTAVPASTIISIFAGLSGAEMLALGVGAGIGAFGISLPSFIEYWEGKRKLGKHWLSFAMNLRGEL